MLRHHLNMVSRRAIEAAISTVSNVSLSRSDSDLSRCEIHEVIVFRFGFDINEMSQVVRQVDLFGREHRVQLQHRKLDFDFFASARRSLRGRLLGPSFIFSLVGDIPTMLGILFEPTIGKQFFEPG